MELTTADLAKARARAAVTDDREAAAWITALAVQVEAQGSRLVVLERSEQAALADATRLQHENEQLRTALAELYTQIGTALKEVA